jgi:MOSC domain-containing protein YiiM
MAVTDCGLQGDKYARPGRRRQVLFTEQEILDEFLLPPGALAEQITVAGISLRALAPSARLRVGAAVLEVIGDCQPCAKMNRLGEGMMELLRGKRGALARVIEGGEIRRGDLCACI